MKAYILTGALIAIVGVVGNALGIMGIRDAQ